MGMFERRLAEGRSFEDQVQRYLQRHPEIRCVSRNGTEHTHPQFVAQLRRHQDPAARFVRFAPDGVALPQSDSTFHWEAKSSIYMERDAYETYCRHEQARCRILLFIRTGRGIFSAWIRDLQFVDSQDIVSQYPPEQRFPVDIEGWITPRQARNRHDLLTGSGTPYKEIDLSQCHLLMGLDDWEQMTGVDSHECMHHDAAK